ncbi:hypothetical protein AKJ09_02600 [Labilithrix luteola]|uniref:Uncharacterized protein n=1 Tax=Labilithrix luteola TaxID=1391654 RepID=A0A0K1PRD2_9BACT|nr:hypothetical protein AKJ09_02600 [Labilithrix luteola]
MREGMTQEGCHEAWIDTRLGWTIASRIEPARHELGRLAAKRARMCRTSRGMSSRRDVSGGS